MAFPLGLEAGRRWRGAVHRAQTQTAVLTIAMILSVVAAAASTRGAATGRGENEP